MLIPPDTSCANDNDYAAGLTDGAASGAFSYSFPPTEKYVYRRVTERRMYPDGGSGSAYESKMTYSRPETTTTNLGYVITEQRNGSGTLLAKSQHYFYGSARESQNPANPKGRWSLEQWTHSWIGENGKTILAKNTFSDLPLNAAGLTAKGNSFGYYDHPGGPPPSQGFARYDNFLIKVYNGPKVCEVGFHVIQTGYTIRWAAGLR